MLGQSSNAAIDSMSMLNFLGFCPDCAAIAPISSAGGRVDFRFDGARLGEVLTDVFPTATPTTRWQRGPVSITPLSDSVLHPSRY